MQDTTTILFVYNLDSGVLQSLHDYSSGKMAGSGATSPLSALTHSPVGMKKEWKRFLKELSIPSRSLDRDEFIAEFGHRSVTFPIVLLKQGPELKILVNSDEIKACRELGDLIALLKRRLAGIQAQ